MKGVQMLKMVRKNCVECPAKCESLFQVLENTDINKLNKFNTSQSFKKGDIIFHQGTPSFGLYCIEEGDVKIYNQADDGREIISKIASTGDLIDMSSLFNTKEYQVSAKALSAVKCCFIEKSQLKEMATNNQHINFELFKFLERELILANQRSNELILKNVKSRLATYLLRTSFTSERLQGRRLTSYLSREELAGHLGSAHETVIRCLTEFKELGYIREENRTFQILNRDKLFELSGGLFS
jgi:CRP-like cAMP-binding protein